MAKSFITPEAILSYPWLLKPQPAQDAGGKAKYSAAFVIPREGRNSPLVQAFEKAAIAIAVEKFGPEAAVKLQTGKLHYPFHADPEDVKDKGYPEGSLYFSARSEERPGMVLPWPDPAVETTAGERPKPKRATDEEVKRYFFAGAYVHAEISLFAFDRNGKKGIGVGLNNLQFLRDGKRLDGRRAPDDVFEADETLAPAELAGL